VPWGQKAFAAYLGDDRQTCRQLLAEIIEHTIMCRPRLLRGVEIKPGTLAQMSASAFAPIVNPTEVPWGQKAFAAYLGDDRQTWREWDSRSA
jgi:hypothetical protein